MEEYRKQKKITLEDMSRLTGVSSGLLGLIEGGYVTHPMIAKKVQSGYELTDEETEMLMPEIHRTTSERYDPNKYKSLKDLRHPTVPPRYEHEELELYIHEHKSAKKEL
jgi:transcriptional regulator with XRE-family HTH domain